MKLFSKNNAAILGMSATVLCAIHCISLPILLSIGSLSGSHLFDNPLMETSLILISIAIGGWIIVPAYQKTKNRLPLILFLISAAILIIFGIFFHSHDNYLLAFGGILMTISYYSNFRLNK